MGHYSVVVRGGEERRLMVHSNVLHEFSIVPSCADVVVGLPIAFPVEGMRYSASGGYENRVHQGEIMVGSKS